MNNLLHCNGELLRVNTPLVTANNRGLRFGDGLFETIKVINGSIPMITLHMQRLQRGLEVLQMALPPVYTPEYITQTILALCKQNNVERAARVRLTIIRGNGTLYTTEDTYATIIIQAESLTWDYLKLNETGFTLGIYADIKKSCDILANLKSNNYLPYVMAALYSRQRQLNDCLILNTHDRLCDAGIANLFWIRDNTIYTPPLSEGGVAGVMRQYLLNQLSGIGYNIQEQPCTVHDIKEANEVFLTNALYGIRWVQNVGTTQYHNQLTTELYNRFVKTMHQVQ